MKKFFDISLSVLTFVLKIPYFWMPASWKGYRTYILTGLLAVFTALETLNLVDLSTRICNAATAIVHLWNPEFVCDLNTLMAGLTSYIGAVLMKLRTETNTSAVFSK